MALYVRELLVDLADGKLGIIERADMECTIQHLVDTGQVDRRDILLVDSYVAGVPVSELSLNHNAVEERLHRVFSLIEHTSGYTDELFLQRCLSRYPKYAPTADAFRKKLDQQSRAFEDIYNAMV